MRRIILVLLFVISINTNAFAYQIQATDKITYEYRNGKPEGKGIPQNWIFEVDEENRTIKEIRAVATYKGATVDVAEGQDTGFYTIIYNSDGRIVAAKIIGQGVEILEFRNNGTYTAFLSTTIPKVEGVTWDIDGTYTVVGFGIYERENSEKGNWNHADYTTGSREIPFTSKKIQKCRGRMFAESNFATGSIFNCSLNRIIYEDLSAFEISPHRKRKHI